VSAPILELPGITVTRESITIEGREVLRGTLRRVYIRKRYDRLPRKMVWFAVVVGSSPIWYLTLFGLSLTVFVRTDLINVVLALYYPLIGVHVVSFGLYIAWCRNRRALRVRLKTTEGTLTAYSTRDKEQAEQVKRAIEQAMAETTPLPLTPNQTR